MPVLFGVNSVANAGGKTLSAIDSQKFYTNEGATGSVTFTLPPALVGAEFTFAVKAAYALVVDPYGTEKISATSGVMGEAGKNISANADGEYIHIACLKTGEWTILDYRGTWTNES
jgi:hypothetical protein